ncbi:MAG: hypothetical protein ACK46Y_18300 [Fluviicola sp.]
MKQLIHLTSELKNQARLSAFEIFRIVMTCTILIPFILLAVVLHDLKSLGFLLFALGLVFFLLRYDLKKWKLIQLDRKNGVANRIVGTVEDLVKETYVVQRSDFICITREVLVNETYYEINRKLYKSIRIGDQIALIVLPNSNRVIQGEILDKAKKPTSIFDFSMQKEVVKNDLRNYR